MNTIHSVVHILFHFSQSVLLNLLLRLTRVTGTRYQPQYVHVSPTELMVFHFALEELNHRSLIATIRLSHS